MADAVLDLIVKLKDEASGPLDKLGGALGSLGAPLAAIGVAGVAAFAAVATAAAGAIKATLDWSEKLDGLGDVLGTTGAESAALTVAIQHVGGDVEKITGQMSFFQKGLTDAKGALGPTGEAAKKLGIDVKSAGFKSKTSSEQIAMLATKVNALPDGLEKSKLMMQLFGKSGKDMSDVMSALADGGLEDARKKAEQWGLVLSDKAIEESINFNRALNDLGMMTQGIAVSLGAELLPALTPIMNAFMKFATDNLPAVRTALADVVKWLVSLFNEGALIPTIIENIGKAFAFVKSSIQDVVDRLDNGDLSGAFGMLAFNIATAFGVSEASADKFADDLERVLDGVIGWVTTNWPLFRDKVVEIFNNVKGWVDTNWPPFRDKIVGVFNSVKTWVDTNWPIFRDKVVEVLGSVKTWVETNWAIVSEKITGAFTTAKTWVDTNWPLFEAAVTTTLTNIKTWVETNWPIAVDFISKKLGDAKAWVDTNWPLFEEAVTKVIANILTYVTDAMPKIETTITTALSNVKQFWVTNGSEIETFASTNWSNIVEIVKTKNDIIVEINKLAWGSMKTDAQTGGVDLTGIFQAAWTAITTTVTLATESIKQILKVALALIKGDTKTALDEAKNLYNTIFGQIEELTGIKFRAIHATIIQVLGLVVQTVSKELTKIKDNFKEAFDNAVKAITETIGSARTAAGNLVDAIKGAIDSKIGAVKEAILGPIRDGIAEVGRLVSNLQTAFNTLKSAVANFRIPSFSPPAAAAPPSGSGSSPGRSGQNSFSAASGQAPVIINIYSRGAGYADVVAAVDEALRKAGRRADARILVGG